MTFSHFWEKTFWPAAILNKEPGDKPLDFGVHICYMPLPSLSHELPSKAVCIVGMVIILARPQHFQRAAESMGEPIGKPAETEWSPLAASEWLMMEAALVSRKVSENLWGTGLCSVGVLRVFFANRVLAIVARRKSPPRPLHSPPLVVSGQATCSRSFNSSSQFRWVPYVRSLCSASGFWRRTINLITISLSIISTTHHHHQDHYHDNHSTKARQMLGIATSEVGTAEPSFFWCPETSELLRPFGAQEPQGFWHLNWWLEVGAFWAWRAQNIWGTSGNLNWVRMFGAESIWIIQFQGPNRFSLYYSRRVSNWPKDGQFSTWRKPHNLRLLRESAGKVAGAGCSRTHLVNIP